MNNFIKEWTEKEVASLNRSFRRHTILVFVLKFILPVVAVFLIAVLFIYPTLASKPKKIVLVANDTPVSTDPGEKPVMVNPKFQGVDSQNQNYVISAKRAIQQEPKVIDLEEVTSDITLNDGMWVSVVAKSGNYNMNTKSIKLSGDVNVFVTDEEANIYQMAAYDADIDIEKGTIQSPNPITMQSTIGQFSAQSFHVERDSEKITFTGPVKLVIFN